MSYENDNRLAIWKNDRKEKATHPDYKGNGTIDGVEYWVSAWAKKADAKANAPVLSISLTRKEGQVVKSTAPATPEFIDDIPF